MLKKLITTTVVMGALGFAAVPSFADGCGSYGSNGKVAKGKPDIVDTAVKAGDFKTLVAAVKAAGLAEVLKGDGPFTVFAPTDDAFAKLPEETLKSLLLPENKKQLQGILTYHVVAGRLDAKSVVASKGAVTVNGQRIDFESKDGQVMVDGARVVATDVDCKNGVIHLIDSVILPSSTDLVSTAQGANAFATLLAAAKRAGLAETLQDGGPFTIFAPTDEAFARLPEGTVETLLKPENSDQLAAILKFHVVSGRVYSEKALEAGAAKTINGESIFISVVDGKPQVQGANIVKTDIDASNGVIHVIDRVMLPPKKTANRNAR